MSLSTAGINYLSRQLLIYGGSLLGAVGIVGSCANIYLLNRPRYRRAQCSLFMLAGACFDFAVLSIALLLFRVLNQIVQSDITTVNVFVCKARFYTASICLPLPIWFVILSAFNRWCMTSRNAARRPWCTPKRCKIMATVLILMLAIYRSPDLYYANIYFIYSRLNCVVSPLDYVYFNLQTYFTFPILTIIIPLIVLTVLILLIRANLRLLAAQQTANRLEQQLTAMVLLQALGAACLVPYALNFCYSTATKFVTKSEYQTAVENLISQVVTLAFYIHYSSAFYIYLIASPEVQRSARSALRMIGHRLGIISQVAPVTVISVQGRRINAIC